MYENLVELFEDSCRKYKNSPLFGTKHQGTWRWLSYGEIEKRVAAVRSGLAELGVEKGDRVAIVADNCVEWAVAAYAVYGRAACYVPMYAAQAPEEWEYILKDCGAKLVFAANPEIFGTLKDIQGRTPGLQHVVGIGLPDSDPESFGALEQRGEKRASPPVYPTRDDLAGYIYTSGTTGNPKGVKLSHHNLCSNVAAFKPLFQVGQSRSLAFLPWAHSYGQVAELHFLLGDGAAIAINDDTDNLVANLAEVKPGILVAVPRIFNRIYDAVNRQMAERPAPIRALFKAAVRFSTLKQSGTPLGLGQSLLLRLADQLIFSKVRQKFGGELKLVISGSAALNPDVAHFIDALGIMVYEGYGLTETSPVATTNRPGHRKIGTVGQAIPGVTITLDESASDEPGEGEIIIKGPNVMQGYHNLPEETARVLTEDGSFRTGDLGRLDAEGYLTITGRLKEQYKLENGKYVAPAHIEEQMRLSPLVSNVMLYGDNRPYNVALVVPDQDAMNRWAKENGVSLGPGSEERVRQLLLAELETHSNCKGYERPRKVAVLNEEFSTANGLLTPSLKIKRRKVAERYQSLIDGLY